MNMTAMSYQSEQESYIQEDFDESPSPSHHQLRMNQTMHPATARQALNNRSAHSTPQIMTMSTRNNRPSSSRAAYQRSGDISDNQMQLALVAVEDY